MDKIGIFVVFQQEMYGDIRHNRQKESVLYPVSLGSFCKTTRRSSEDKDSKTTLAVCESKGNFLKFKSDDTVVLTSSK